MEDDALKLTLRVVDDPELAAALTDDKQWNLMGAFMARERTLSDAAQHLRVKLPTLSYRVGKLLRVGALEVARTEGRRGSPIKYYRAVARHFFVPFRVTPLKTLESLLESSHGWFDERVKRALARVFFEATRDWGVNLYSDEPGKLNLSFSPVPERDDAFVARSLEPSFPAVYDSNSVLALRHADAKALQRDLDLLYRRYAALGSEGQHPYLVRLTLVPGIRR